MKSREHGHFAGRILILLIVSLLLVFLVGCPFEDDSDYPPPPEEEAGGGGVPAPIPVTVELDDTGQIATVTRGDKVYTIDVTTSTGTLDPGAIDILDTDEVNGSFFLLGALSRTDW